MLEPYGGLGAIPRSLQFSHWYLDSELTQLQSFGVAIPLIFLGVAAFLLNVVLTRIVAVQREQIAMLKALGYANREVGLHYVQWGVVIAAVGTVIGIAAGRWFGSGLVSLYSDYFRFPVLIYRLMPVTVVTGVAVSAAAAVLGALGAVRQAVRLPPAEAMRPEPPKDYRESWIERVGLRGLLSPPARMVARNLQRQPFRTVTSIVGIAFGAAILIVGTFFIDAMDELMEVQFQVAQRQDVTVSFVEPASARAFHEVTHLPGVISAEPMRVVPARLRSGHRVRQLAVTGLPARPSLHRVVDRSLRPIELPRTGSSCRRSSASCWQSVRAIPCTWKCWKGLGRCGRSSSIVWSKSTWACRPTWRSTRCAASCVKGARCRERRWRSTVSSSSNCTRGSRRRRRWRGWP